MLGYNKSMNLTDLGISELKIKSIMSTMESQSLWTASGCLERQKSPNKDGYTNIRIYDKVYAAHRLTFLIKKGAIGDGAIIMHSCDNRRCINIEHLSEGTHARNVHDCIAKKRTDWQQKPAPVVTIKSTDVGRYQLNTVFEAINRRLHGEEIPDISTAMTIPVKRIEEWMRKMFGTINVGVMLDIQAEFDPVVKLVTLLKPRVVPAPVREKREKTVSAVAIAKDMVRRRKEKRDSDIVGLYDLGVHPLDIVDSVGCSTSTVRCILMRDRGLDYVSFKRGKSSRVKSM